MDLAEVTVGVEDGGGGLVMCGRAVQQRTTVRWHGRICDDGEAVAVWLRSAGWRGRQGEASGVSELARERW